MSTDEQRPAEETVNRESHPSSSGPAALSGDLGISSERIGVFDGIEGTGTLASAQGTTDGETPTTLPGDVHHVGSHGPSDADEPAEKPDETSPVTQVDKTVGEVQPDPVQNKQTFDPDRNPRH